MSSSRLDLVLIPTESTTHAVAEAKVDNKTSWPQGDTFTWHGGELLFIPTMMALGIVGNLLVFYIYHFRWRSSTVTLFKRMLAVLDLCNLFLAWPTLLAITLHPYCPSFMAACVFTSYVALGTAITSGCVLVIIAVDRFMKLCLLRKTGIRSLLAKKLFAASCFVSLLLNIPIGWIFGRDTIHFVHYGVQVSYCFIHSESKSTTVFILYASMLAVVFLSITVTLFVLYFKIVRQLHQLSKKHDELKRRPSLAASGEVLKKQKQSQVMRSSAIVFIAVTVAFFASYAPYFCTLILSMADPSVEGSMSPWTKALYDLAKTFPIMNNVANPFIYSFTSGNFRKEVKKMLTFKTCQKGGFFRRRAFSLSNRSYEMSQYSESSQKEDATTGPSNQ
ncbi:somatostatin receptor type 2 [Aplysia californica]|uniref:Somatostatin receptor type 2 n=1 Tax=Aplysia californica TaxID=6500 RepID=A0ABM0JK84_APLCA|nr:somatostatin receptor type 2 [Aplysia californica]